MKKLYVLAGAICAVISVSYAQPFGNTDAEVRKQGLFKQLPDSIPIRSSSLQALMLLDAGSNVIMEISRDGHMPLEGTVVYRSEKYNGRIQTISIRSHEFEDALLHLSRVVDENGSVVYRGTWAHPEFADVYLLQQEGRDYLLTKKRFRDLVVE